MDSRKLAAFAAALMLAVPATAAYATDLVIYHTWSTPSEIAALNVLRTQLTAAGDTWTDIAIPHDTGANVSLTNMVTGGNPPNVFMNSDPGIIRDLTKQGLTVPMTQFFKDNDVTPHFPETVLRAITVDGQIMKIPTGVHIDGMVYYNLEVAKKAGVDPASWTSLDQMFADFPKIKAAGFQPLAVGSQDFQVGYLTHALVAAIGGTDIYNRMYGEKPDPTVFDTPEFRKVLETVRQFADNADQGSANRAWNETTNLVISGKALMQIHGDWMKGEWRNAGKVAGKDFGCVNIPGTKALAVTVDAWGLLGGPSVDEAHKAAELQFAKIVVDRQVTADFAIKKGSSPVRLDAPTTSLDQCNLLVLDSLKKDNFSVQNPFNISDADWIRSIWDIMFKYWGNPKMSPDEVITQMKAQYDTIFG